MIENLRVLDSSFNTIAIIDTAASIIWQSVYFGVGSFEIYATASPALVQALQVDRYITRDDNYEVGIIESVNITNDQQNGLMITASGRFAKSVLDRRVICNLTAKEKGIYQNSAYVLKGKVEIAVRDLIKSQVISDDPQNPRAFGKFDVNEADISGYSDIITTVSDTGETVSAEKQVAFKGLLDYTDSLLQEYGMSAYCYLYTGWYAGMLFGALRYKIFRGINRSIDNTDGNSPVVFSQDFENLISTDYTYDKSVFKNVALIGGQGEGIERVCAAVNWFQNRSSISDFRRRELFVDANSMAQDEGVSLDEYRQQLETQGLQNLSQLSVTETFSGKIDTENTQFVLGKDYNLGDIITIQDAVLGKYINVRILSITEVQDVNGYTVEIEYGN